MKSYFQFVGVLLLSAVVFSGCEDLLNADSDRFLNVGDNKLDSPNDTVYSIIGIHAKLDKIADRYILLGELRGDLLGLTENATETIRDIYFFDAKADNPYVNVSDFYSIINACNYVICNIDTSIVVNAEKRLYKEMAAAKAIRAWTYMQIALNFGSARYYEKPILTIKDAEKQYPQYDLNQLAPLLIADIEPWKNLEAPGYAMFNIEPENQSFFPIRFILGDLYLWTGQYEKAASIYRELMFERKMVITSTYQSSWEVINGVFVERTNKWSNLFNTGTTEQLTILAGPVENLEGSVLDSIFMYNYEVLPSNIAINNWTKSKYYHSANEIDTVYGDLRGLIGSYFPEGYYLSKSNSSGDVEVYKTEGPVIRKFWLMSTFDYRAVCVYRKALLYLRYAEAVNQLKKPNLAFAVLKNGLNAVSLASNTIVPPQEKPDPLPLYMNFTDDRFKDNIGIHARGCGNVHLVEEFKIPALPTLEDSVAYVDELILRELALETAFEGNRFHDLMRFSLRRDNPEEYLSEKVSLKYQDQAGMKQKLKVRSSWFLPSE